MQTWESLILILGFLILELVLFHGFYSRRTGRVAVYTAWYAWIIDVLAMFSGVSIMGLSLVCLYNPWIFNLPVPGYLFITLFIFGSWQFGIHFVKLIIRSAKEIIKKRKFKKANEESLKDFEAEYNRSVENYFKDLKDDGGINNSNKK